MIFNRYSGYDKETVVSKDHNGYVTVRTSQVSNDPHGSVRVYENETNDSFARSFVPSTFRGSKPLLVQTSEMFPSFKDSEIEEKVRSRNSEKVNLFQASTTDNELTNSELSSKMNVSIKTKSVLSILIACSESSSEYANTTESDAFSTAIVKILTKRTPHK